MAIFFNQQITTVSGGFGSPFGCGCMPMAPMPMTPCTIFGPTPYPVAPMPMAPVPMFPIGCCYPMSDAMAAGYCTGAILGMPGVLNAIGDGLKWGYNNIIKPVWNGVVKPAWNFVKNDILKPIGKGLKWVWDHTLGWVFKKMEGAVDASNAKKAEEKAEAEAEAAEEAAEAAEEAQEASEE